MNMIYEAKQFLAYVLTLFVVFTTLQSCDKEGNPLPNGSVVEMNYNERQYIEEGRMILVPGARSGPELNYYMHGLPSYANGVNYIVINSNLRQKGSKDRPEHTIQISIPVGDELLLGHEYAVDALPDHQVIRQYADDWGIYYENHIAFFRYNRYLDFSESYYDTGKVIFTNLIKNQSGSSTLEGTFEVFIPLHEDQAKSEKLQGKFKLAVTYN